MALILEQSNATRLVWRNIKIETPKESGGYREDKIRVQFQLMNADDLKDKSDDQVVDFLKTVINDVTGVKQSSEDKEDISFSPELVSQLLEIPWIRTALMKEYLLIPLGKKGALKN